MLMTYRFENNRRDNDYRDIYWNHKFFEKSRASVVGRHLHFSLIQVEWFLLTCEFEIIYNREKRIAKPSRTALKFLEYRYSRLILSVFPFT